MCCAVAISLIVLASGCSATQTPIRPRYPATRTVDVVDDLLPDQVGAQDRRRYGVLATRYDLRPMTILAMIGGAGMIYWFGTGQADITSLPIVVALGGFFTNSATCGALLAAVMVFLLNEHGTSASASVTPAPVTTN
jgi:hypothetical protein